MIDADIANTYIRYSLEGSETDSWAPEELGQLAINEPKRAWHIIKLINAIQIEDEAWSSYIRSTLGCGAIEDLLVLHEDTMLPIILQAAKSDAILRMELSTIYESSVTQSAWLQIRTILAQLD